MTELLKIDGLVENLRIEKGYQDLIFSKADGKIAGVAAIGAAAMGQVASSTILSNASAGSEIGMDFFSCVVNGKNLRGGFHKVEFKNDDHMEFVVEAEGDFLAVHAARSPDRRILWMLPHQIRGHRRQKFCDIRWSFQYPALLIVLIGICEFFFDEDFGHREPSEEFWFYTLFFALTVFITVMIRLRFRGFARKATEVIRALGYENPEDVDLSVVHKKAQKALASATNTLPPLLEPWSYRY